MSESSANSAPEQPSDSGGNDHLFRNSLMGLVLGVLCGLFFGEICAHLEIIGQAYIGLLQMTVLPYVLVSLIGQLGRMNLAQVGRLGIVALVLLVILWVLGIGLVILGSLMLPEVSGSVYFSGDQQAQSVAPVSALDMFIPRNIFHSLASDIVPAVVVFSLFFGIALVSVPGKERLLDLCDVCARSISRVNFTLVRAAPVGLFALTASAAGTLRLEDLSRLQAYILALSVISLLAVFVVVPLLVSAVTPIGYREFLKAAKTPLLTAFATGKLFVVLPQIIEACEQLSARDRMHQPVDASSVIVPLAYPFPHLGKILGFVFISFAGWYVGNNLSVFETAEMAATGTVASFASPLVTMPMLLDQYHLPQDLVSLLIIPGFLTIRLGDIAGVAHLMGLTLIVGAYLSNSIRIRWPRLGFTAGISLVLLISMGVSTRWYLSKTVLNYSLDEQLLAQELPFPADAQRVLRARPEGVETLDRSESILERVKTEQKIRVGYHPDHLPYSYFNSKRNLVGLDIDLMHRLASELDMQLEFLPWSYDTLQEQLDSGEIDLAVGGLIVNPDRLTRMGFTEPYLDATISVLLHDHNRHLLTEWFTPRQKPSLTLGVISPDLVSTAQRQLPDLQIVPVLSYESFFATRPGLPDGLIVTAEEGAAWNVLYPQYEVTVPEPVIRRPVAFAVRAGETEWLRVLDGWLEYERLAGVPQELRKFWIDGGWMAEKPPRWSILKDVLHWDR